MRNQLKFPPGAACPSSSAASVPCLQAPLKLDSFPMNSQWKKGKLIGCGRFGRVYVAINSENGALLCAMKEVDLFPDDPQSAECVKQLEQEIKLLSNLQHPNIVQYFGSDREEDRFFIYLEYVHPGSLKKYIHDHGGTLTESVVRSFTRHILSGLAYLHSKKIVHRDIKGANLLVDASGVVKLADFGVAKLLTGQRADLSLQGSPYWMAPELMQAVKQKDSTPDLAFAVDIWSLGCTIIEMFTGKPPWSEFERQAAMFKAFTESPPIPESMSPEGKDFLRLCFLRNPADRPTASMLLEHRFLKNSLQPTSPNNNDSPKRHPSALDMFERIIEAAGGKQIVMFLGYDGTLSPIVDDPDRAFMSSKMRRIVKKMAKCFPTSIVTGRCIDKVYSFVKLAELYYAGSHGMDIKGPTKGFSRYNKDKPSVLYQPADDFLPMIIDEVYKQLVGKTKSTAGAKVENNKFCLSVHFRCVDEKKWSELALEVRSVVQNYPTLKLSQGRKVFEIRPMIKWDKGKALEFLLESLGFENCNDVFPIYIGDDRTDEDAFKLLRERGQGFGILVSKFPKDTSASYSLQDPPEVMNFLRRLVEWKQMQQ